MTDAPIVGPEDVKRKLERPFEKTCFIRDIVGVRVRELARRDQAVSPDHVRPFREDELADAMVLGRPVPFFDAVFTAAVPVLVVILVPYVFWIDRRLKEPRDGAWHLGAWIAGRLAWVPRDIDLG